MARRSPTLRLADIIEAIEHIYHEAAGVTLDEFKADWRKRWLVERGIEIISEASRHLTRELIPTAEIVDSSNDFGGWYRAPGWRAAARRTKTHANGHSL